MPSGTPGNDTLVLTSPVFFDQVDMGDGRDELTLADSPDGNYVAVSNAEVVIGGSGNDAVTLYMDTMAFVKGNVSVDLKGGVNTLYFGDPIPGLVGISNVHHFIGSYADDLIGFDIPAAGTSTVNVDMDQGNDTFYYNIDLPSSALPSAITVIGAETITGFTKASADITIGGQATGTNVTMSGTSDVLRLTTNALTNTLTSHGAETIIGSEDRDVVRVDLNYGPAKLDLGVGNDRVELLGSNMNSVEVTNVEALLGRGIADNVVLSGASPIAMSIDLGGGQDSLLALGLEGRSLLVSNTETIVLGSGGDSVNVRTALKNGVIDMGDGLDFLTLQGSGNSVSIINAEDIIGGAGADKLTLQGVNGAYVDAGAGADVVIGTDHTDILYGNLGGDTLNGGGGDDFIIGGLGKDTMTGGEGADRFVFRGGADSDLATRDIITDFQVGVDKLEFENMLQGQFTLVTETAFSGFTANGQTQAHFLDATDQLLFDVNGDGAMDMRMTLQGVDGTQLAATDFIWSFD